MKQHLLVVDDEASIRDLLGKCLISSGYRVTAVASAAEALRIAKDERPDLIITDLQLEDGDGWRMIAELKAERPKRPVILLTGVLFDPQVVNELLPGKVDCYLEKTSSLAKILEAVRRLVGPPSAS